jgi:hypothetical protein
MQLDSELVQLELLYFIGNQHLNCFTTFSNYTSIMHCSNCGGTNAQLEFRCVVRLRILYIAIYSKKH